MRSLDLDGVDATRTTLDYWFDPASEQHRSREWIEFLERVVAGGEPMCESVQRGMSSGHFDHGWLHPEGESALTHFHDLIQAILPEEFPRP